MAKAITAALKTLLLSNTYLVGGDLYTLTLADGTVLRWADLPQNTTVGGNAFTASASGVAPGLSRTGIRTAIGLEAETMDVELMFDTTTLLLGLTPAAFANGGGFDGARIQIDRLLTDTLADTSRGTVNVFTGLITDVEAYGGKVTLHASSDLVFLNSTFPRDYFLPACNNALFDSRCTLLAATFKVSLSATGGDTKTISSGATQATDYFSLGYVVIKTGANAGLKRMVKSYSSGSFTLLYPLPQAMANGDTFDAYPGCDKTQTSCSTKFSNLAHFGGFPYVPTPETIELGSASQRTGGGGSGSSDRPAGGSGGQSTQYKQL